MVKTEDALLAVADAYVAAVADRGGKSLARVATIVANRGSFFDPLRQGQTCSVRNLDKFVAYFADPTNWPGGTIPSAALNALASLGRGVSPAATV